MTTPPEALVIREDPTGLDKVFGTVYQRSNYDERLHARGLIAILLLLPQPSKCEKEALYHFASTEKGVGT